MLLLHYPCHKFTDSQKEVDYIEPQTHEIVFVAYLD